MQPKPMTDDEIAGIVQNAMDEAVDFVESEISDARLKAQRYMDGEVDIGHEDGRSKVVSSKVRDVVRAVKPSLMRVFMSSTRPVEFIPRGPEDVQMAEQASAFVSHEFERLDGFKLLSDAFHDSLVKGQGVLKAYYRDYPESKIYTFTDLSDDEYTLLVSDDDVTVLEHSTEMSLSVNEFGAEMEMPIHEVKLSKQTMKGKLCIESVPPEEFFVDRNCRSLKDSYISAHRTEMRAGDLISMGIDPEIVYKLDSIDSGSEMTEAEVYERQGYDHDSSDSDEMDKSMKPVTVTEAYMRMDVDGTGYPVLHKFLLGGTKYELLDHEPTDEICFCIFEHNPEPHTFFGNSLASMLTDDQDAATAILRGILDNVAMVNNPRIGVVQGQAEMSDVLNNEIGAVVRLRSPNALQPITTPFTAGQTLAALTYMDQLVEAKSGVSNNVALNADALQSTTKSGVDAAVEAAQGSVEVMTRNLASGVRDLFGLILRIVHKNVDEEQMMRLNGSFAPVDPRIWDISMDVQINVGLGTGRKDEKAAALQQALAVQQQVYQTMGPMNGIVSLTNMRNTLADLLAASGVRNADRYFAPMTPEMEQQMLMMQQQQQAAMAQQQQQDPNAAFLQAEQMKAQAKMQGDMAKLQLDAQKAAAADDLARDQMAQDLMVQAAQTYGKYATNVDVAAVKAEQDKFRTMAGMAQGQQGPQQ